MEGGLNPPYTSNFVMSDRQIQHKRVEWISGAAILLLFGVISVVGITWGLPSRKIDKYLFGDGEPWAGEKIYRLAGAAEKFSPDRGADVDVDPLDKSSNEPIPLTATDKDVAKIYLRYRLYTYQPDEMITMMALAGMNPRKLDLDPRLYQYGGLFIYPVGAIIGLCGLADLIDVRSDVVYYLDNPDEFGKFYIVARAYAAVWGFVGVLVVFAIGRRLVGSWAGLLAALLFTLMPVVVCMAHEGKPHLPGAVLMLLAVLFAMRHLDQRATGFRSRDWWLMCVCCGAAFGMVLSSWPIFVLIPVVAWMTRVGGTVKRSLAVVEGGSLGLTFGDAARRTVIGVVVGVGVYLATNPYIVINAIVNREVLRSNFGNSLAMYEIARIGEGLVRVVELTIEGATLPVLLLGVVAVIAVFVRRSGSAIPLAVPAVVLFLQFVLIGAGKPAEYGRFGIFTNTALAIGTACVLTRKWTKLPRTVNWMPGSFVVIWVAFFGAGYLSNFYVDTTEDCSRIRMAKTHFFSDKNPSTGRCTVAFAVLADPGPYCFPPIDFSLTDILRFPSQEQLDKQCDYPAPVPIIPVDRRDSLQADSFPEQERPQGRLLRWIVARDTPISWANKPYCFGSWPATGQ